MSETVLDKQGKMHIPYNKLTDEQIRFYNEEGYLVLPALLTVDDMKPVRAAMMEKVGEIAESLLVAGLVSQGFEEEPFESRLARLFEGLSDEEFLKFGRSWRERRPGYFHLMSNPKILDVVESLIGSEIFANPVYNVRPKVPKVAAGAVPWHQDKSYWPDANSNPVITIWIPLVDANAENGCLHIWSRTHKQPLLSFHTEDYSGTGYLEVDKQHLKKVQAVPLPVSAGSAIAFNDRCVHMSTPNNSQMVRWSVDLRYQPTDQDPMPQHGIGFLARSRQHPEKVATLEDWLAYRSEHIEEAK
jgi:ectoine hydroxylase-related dioxygenase (phytanoyl-CoA dioxygenase family)